MESWLWLPLAAVVAAVLVAGITLSWWEGKSA
jgi:hypothetical protein